VTAANAIPGAAQLVGRGVYEGVPAAMPQPVRDRHAVVVGRPAGCAAAAARLTEAGWKVTVVTRDGCCCAGLPRECRRKAGTAVVCATGIEYLEAVVLRRVDSGRVEAYAASALFVL
jgi:hypothetical protein